MYFMPFSNPYNKAQAHFLNGSGQIGPFMPILAHFQMDRAKLGLSCPLWPIKVDFGFIQKNLLLV